MTEETKKLKHFKLTFGRHLYTGIANRRDIGFLPRGTVVSLIEVEHLKKNPNVYEEVRWWHVIAGDQVGWIGFFADEIDPQPLYAPPKWMEEEKEANEP